MHNVHDFVPLLARYILDQMVYGVYVSQTPWSYHMPSYSFISPNSRKWLLILVFDTAMMWSDRLLYERTRSCWPEFGFL